TLTLGADSTVAGTVTAEKIDATGKTLTQDGVGTVTVTGADGIVATKLVQSSAGTVTTDKVSGDVEQTGAATLAANDPNNGLEVTGTLTQSDVGANVGSDAEDVTLGKLDQTGGTVTAKTLTLGDDSSVGGAVDASVAVAADGKNLEVTDTGSLTAPTITAAALTTAGKVEASIKIAANVTQTDGTIETPMIEGNLVQDGGKIDATGTALTVTGTTEQNDGEIGNEDASLVFTGKLTQKDGTITANTLEAKAGADIAGTVEAKTSVTAAGQTVDVKGTGSLTAPTITAAALTTAGKVEASTKIAANVTQTDGTIETPMIEGNLVQDAGKIDATGTALTVTGTTEQNDGEIGNKDAELVFEGKLIQNGGTIAADTLKAGSGLDQTAGTVTAKTLTLGADSKVEGTVTADNIDASDTTFTVDGATVTATDIKAKILEVLGGTVATATVTGDLEESGGEVAADSVSGNVELSGGELTTGAIGGDFALSGGTFVAKDNELTVAGATTQESGTKLGDSDDTFKFEGGLTQKGGELEAAKVKLEDDSVVMGTVNVAEVDATGKKLTVDGAAVTSGAIAAETLDVDGGSVSSDTVTVATLDVDGGTVTAGAVDATTVDVDVGSVVATDSVKADKVNVGSGVFVAADVSGDLAVSGTGDATVTTLTGDMDVSGGMVDVGTVVGDSTVSGGDVSAASLHGNLSQTGGAVASNDVTGNVDLSGGELTTGEIGGDFVFSGGTVVANGDSLTVGGVTTQEGGTTLGDGGDRIVLGGGLVQNGGTINAAQLTLGGTTTQSEGASVVTPDLVLAADGKDVSLGSSENAIAKVTGAANSFDITTGGSILVDDASATGGNASVTASDDITVQKIAASDTVTLRSQNGSVVGAETSNVTAEGLVISAMTGIGADGAPLNTDVGHLEAQSTSGGVYIHDLGDVDIRGVSAAEDVDLSSDGAMTISGNVTADNADILSMDDMTISGTVGADGTADVTSLADVTLSGGTVSGNTVNVTAADDITQTGSTIADSEGYADGSGVRSAIVAQGAATLTSTGGSIGSVGEGSTSYVGVDAGSVKANASRDVAIAGDDSTPLTVDAGGVTGGGNVSLYAPNTIVTTGTIAAGDRLTITAGNFTGGTLSVNPGKTLATHNFVDGQNPLIAIYGSVSGGNADPKIENLPNHVLVFLDGRVAGGDLKTINQLGSVEAFPVQTPELKSEQGVFGNPTFLHGELDVANPLAVGAIDFILQEIPRQTFSSDFPVEVDQQILANGLNPTTSYWFGQHPQSEDESADAAEESDTEEL
ncbi:MAG: hypothetical protein J6U17_04595, partial [Kiritimatiellae bacterium]|nr:hypothetical protein [Kiritimatiellia bacterium]